MNRFQGLKSNSNNRWVCLVSCIAIPGWNVPYLNPCRRDAHQSSSADETKAEREVLSSSEFIERKARLAKTARMNGNSISVDLLVEERELEKTLALRVRGDAGQRISLIIS